MEFENPKKNFQHNTIFLDFQSTTPLDPRVLDAMMPYNTELFGNPHSKSHVYGWKAEDAVETAREVLFKKFNSFVENCKFNRSR